MRFVSGPTPFLETSDEMPLHMPSLAGTAAVESEEGMDKESVVAPWQGSPT
jgi:hypothetical protein